MAAADLITPTNILRKTPQDRDLSDIVCTGEKSGYKSVRYYELIPLLIEALKEEDGISKGQSETIARQQAEIQRLTVANQAALQQLKELQEVKAKTRTP